MNYNKCIDNGCLYEINLLSLSIIKNINNMELGLINKAFRVFKKMQKLAEDDFAAQVECQQVIFKLMLEMSEEELDAYNEKIEEFMKNPKK